jgi:hypothetical protein
MHTLAALGLLGVACGSAPKRAVAELEDPGTCKDCHSQHYAQWAGSMHAYASDDPVFVAMNRRGQREAQVGTFCVNCHAPMAIALGLVTVDNVASVDLSTLPAKARGITCYFCHDVANVIDDHNNGIQLALDQTMRGGLSDTTDSPAHDSRYDKLMDGHTNDSLICGSCHDVVTPRGVELERTYKEWQGSVQASHDPTRYSTCSGCHMRSLDLKLIADGPGLTVKHRDYPSFHDHALAAVDQALPPSTDQAAALQQVMDAGLAIEGIIPQGLRNAPGGICVRSANGGEVTVRVDTVAIGHDYPSGAAQDRRVWLEVIAYDANNTVVASAGTVPDHMDPEDYAPAAFARFACPTGADGLVSCASWMFWDRTYQMDGTPAHFFWDVASDDVSNNARHVLRKTIDPMLDHSITVELPVGTAVGNIDHVTARLRTRPFAYSVLRLLVQSGDLDPFTEGQLESQQALEGAGTTQTWSRAGMDAATRCCPLGHLSC